MKDLRLTLIAVASLALAAGPLQANAATHAAKVIYAFSQVQANSAAGKARLLRKGDRVFPGETVATRRGRAQIKFTDGGFASLQPNTEYRIDEYNFNGKADGKERSFLSLVRGSVRLFTGVIGKANYKNFRIKTKVATIGIRGTHLKLSFKPSGPSAAAKGANVPQPIPTDLTVSCYKDPERETWLYVDPVGESPGFARDVHPGQVVTCNPNGCSLGEPFVQREEVGFFPFSPACELADPNSCGPPYPDPLVWEGQHQDFHTDSLLLGDDVLVKFALTIDEYPGGFADAYASGAATPDVVLTSTSPVVFSIPSEGTDFDQALGNVAETLFYAPLSVTITRIEDPDLYNFMSTDGNINTTDSMTSTPAGDIEVGFGPATPDTVVSGMTGVATYDVIQIASETTFYFPPGTDNGVLTDAQFILNFGLNQVELITLGGTLGGDPGGACNRQLERQRRHRRPDFRRLGRGSHGSRGLSRVRGLVLWSNFRTDGFRCRRPERGGLSLLLCRQSVVSKCVLVRRRFGHTTLVRVPSRTPIGHGWCYRWSRRLSIPVKADLRSAFS